MDLNLKSKKVLITGASQGIGAAIAREFASEKANLILVARSEYKLKSLKEELVQKYHIECDYLALDISKDENVEKLIDSYSDIDILINNAGAIPGGDLFNIDIKGWKKSWDLKVWAYINLTRGIYTKMKQRNIGVIINIIGIAGDKVINDYIAGTVGNAGLIAFTKAIGSRSLEDGIRVLGINPGLTATERIQKLNDNVQINSSASTQRMADVVEISNVVVFLSSEKASYITGTVINIDGGFASRNSFTE